MNKEKTLIKRCIQGDRPSQKQLYECYKVRLFAISMRYASNKLEAEDILQEGMFKILKNLNQYNGTGSLYGWMKKVIVNTALMHIRKYRKLKTVDIDDQSTLSLNAVDSSLMNKDRAAAIILMIRQLPPLQQTIFNLRVFDGYSFNEISKELKMNDNTIRSHFLRARKAMQKLLQKSLTE